MCSSARMMSLAALVVCLGVMSSVMAESSDEYYYNSLYKDGEGYNDKNVRNLDGIENQLDTWLMLGYPHNLFRKRQMDSIGGGSLLKKRFGDKQKMEQNHQTEGQSHQETTLFNDNSMETMHQQQLEPRTIAPKTFPFHQSLLEPTQQQLLEPEIAPKSPIFHQSFQEPSQQQLLEPQIAPKNPIFHQTFQEPSQQQLLEPKIAPINSLFHQNLMEQNRQQPELELNPSEDHIDSKDSLQKWSLFSKFPKISPQKRQIDSIGGGSLLKRSFIDEELPSKSEFTNYFPMNMANSNNKPEFYTQKRQFDSIGGGNLLKRSSLDARDSGSKPGFEEYFFDKWVKSDVNPKLFFTQKRQMDSIGGGSLLKRSFIGREAQLQPEFVENVLRKWTNLNIPQKFLPQKRQMDSIGGGSLLKRSFLDKEMQMETDFDENVLKKLINFKNGPGFFTQKRQIDSIGGGSLLKRSTMDKESLSQPEFVENSQYEWVNKDLGPNHLFRQKRQIDSIGGGSLLKRNSAGDRNSSLSQQVVLTKTNREPYTGAINLGDLEKFYMPTTSLQNPKGLNRNRFSDLEYVQHLLAEYLGNQRPKIQMIGGGLGTGMEGTLGTKGNPLVEGNPLQDQTLRRTANPGTSLEDLVLRRPANLGTYLEDQTFRRNANPGMSLGNHDIGGTLATTMGVLSGKQSSKGYQGLVDYLESQKPRIQMKAGALQVGSSSSAVSVPENLEKQLMETSIKVVPELKVKDFVSQSDLRGAEDILIRQRPRIQIKEPSTGSRSSKNLEIMDH